jgi:type V secretory pathway adhesin AidA
MRASKATKGMSSLATLRVTDETPASAAVVPAPKVRLVKKTNRSMEWLYEVTDLLEYVLVTHIYDLQGSSRLVIDGVLIRSTVDVAKSRFIERDLPQAGSFTHDRKGRLSAIEPPITAAGMLDNYLRAVHVGLRSVVSGPAGQLRELAAAEIARSKATAQLVSKYEFRIHLVEEDILAAALGVVRKRATMVHEGEAADVEAIVIELTGADSVDARPVDKVPNMWDVAFCCVTR